jgi:hypothetical protein
MSLRKRKEGKERKANALTWVTRHYDSQQKMCRT